MTFVPHQHRSANSGLDLSASGLDVGDGSRRPPGIHRLRSFADEWMSALRKSPVRPHIEEFVRRQLELAEAPAP